MKEIDNKWNEFRRNCLSRQQLSPSTIKDTIRKLRFLERHGIDLDNFTEDDIYNHFARRFEDGASNIALNHYVKALNRWCRFKDFDYHFELYKELKKPIRVPTTDDISRMLDVCKRKPVDRRNKLIILFMAKTGVRNQELCDIRLDDIDWKNKVLTIRKGKGGKTRIIPLEEKLLIGKNYPSIWNYIDHWRCEKGKYLFTTKKRGMTPNYLRMLIKIIGRKVGIPWIHPHSLRHYAATNLLRAGANIRVVQEIMGHSSIKTTGQYLHVIGNDLHKAIENPDLEDPIRSRPLHKKNDLKTFGENPICYAIPTEELLNGPSRIRTGDLRLVKATS